MKFSALLVLIGAFAILNTGCSQVTGESLLNDKRSASTEFNVDKKPSFSELYLKVYTPILNVPAGATTIDIAGECSFSSYPRHQIAIEPASGTQALVFFDPGSSTLGSSNVGYCHNGRFSFVVNANSVPTGLQNSYRVRLMAYESSSGGSPIINESAGASNLTITRIGN